MFNLSFESGVYCLQANHVIKIVFFELLYICLRERKEMIAFRLSETSASETLWLSEADFIKTNLAEQPIWPFEDWPVLERVRCVAKFFENISGLTRNNGLNKSEMIYTDASYQHSTKNIQNAVCSFNIRCSKNISKFLVHTWTDNEPWDSYLTQRICKHRCVSGLQKKIEKHLSSNKTSSDPSIVELHQKRE